MGFALLAIHEVVVHQGRDGLQGVARRRDGERLRRLQCATAVKDGELAKYGLGTGREQVVAPQEGVPEGLLAEGEVDGPGRQQPEPII